MKTPFASLWSKLRGDRYMVNAYPSAVDVPGEAHTAVSDTPSAAAPRAAEQDA